jgi:hypothetical protein
MKEVCRQEFTVPDDPFELFKRIGFAESGVGQFCTTRAARESRRQQTTVLPFGLVGIRGAKASCDGVNLANAQILGPMVGLVSSDAMHDITITRS